jgi:hypothetical protein
VRSEYSLSRVPPWFWYTAFAVGVGLLAWNLYSNYQAVVRGRIADARAWAIVGPPCPRIDAATFLERRYRQGPKRFDYQKVTFFRRHGHVSCAPIYEEGGKSDRFHAVCQFTSPGQLLIRTAKGDWYFEPGPGRPATVSMQGGQARCVLAAKFTIQEALKSQ